MNRFFFLLLASMTIAVTTLWAGGQPEAPPVIPLDIQTRPYLAPENPDSINKTLTLPFAPQASGKQVLKAWSFTVYDASGRQVWSESKTEMKDRGFFGELFNLGDRPRVEVPVQLIWDGKSAENGDYTFILTVTDSQGLTTRTPPVAFTIQNAPVRITRLGIDYAIFSPRGKRNTVTVRQAGTRELRWEGTFIDTSQKPVRSFLWENTSNQVLADQAPQDFEWDGKDDNGQVLPEGEYHYSLKGTNRAGASVIQILDQPVVISEKPGVLRLTSEQNIFSTRADKSWPTVFTFRPDSGNAEGLVDWAVTITDPNHPKVALWSKTGKAPLPETLVFEGKDLLGRALPEGKYQALLSANFNNGNSGESPANTFEIDLTPPQGSLQIAQKTFGGTGRLTLPVVFVGDGNVTWTLEILGPGAKSLRSFPLGDVGKASLEIPSTDSTGKPLPDGPYTLRATAHDRAGNLSSSLAAITKDTRSMKVSLNPSSLVLVPGNSVNGTVTVAPVLEVPDSVVRSIWSVASLDAKGVESKPVDQKTIEADVPAYEWAPGRSLPDGAYRISLSVTYSNGTVSQAQKDLRIDTNYLKEPQGTLTVSAPVFGGNERTVFTVFFRGDSGIPWQLSLLDKTGKEMGQYPLGSGGEASVTIPTAAEGPLADGVYTLRATAKSVAGVAGTIMATIKKDSRPMKASLDLSRGVLVPGKGANGQVRITPLLQVLDSVETSTVEIRSPLGQVFTQESRTGLMTFWDWDGKNATETAADGIYKVSWTVRYANGNLSKASADLKVDSTELQGTLAVSAPVFGSTNRPSISVTFAGTPGYLWTLDILDKADKSIRQFPLGDTGKAALEIGTDAAGKPLPDGVYTLRASAKKDEGITGTVITSIRKDSRPLKVSIDLSSPILVPGNSLNGTVKVSPVLEVLDSIETTILGLSDAEGRTIDEKTWQGLVPFWEWDGKDPLGKAQPDGMYRLTLTVAYANGARSQAQKELRIDSTYLKEPRGNLTSTSTVFGGLGRPGVTVSFEGDQGISWNLEILGMDGKTVVRYPLGDTGNNSFEFQGLDDQKRVLPDGPYTLRASAVSKAGVSGTALLQLRKDSRQGNASLDLSRTVLVPGRGANGVVRITPILEVVDSVEKTVLSVLGPDGKTIGEKSSEGTVPFWDWAGQDSKGKNLGNGTYQIALTVNYANGSVARAQSEVKIDSTYLNDQGPLVEMTLSTKTFAPNNVDGPTDLTVLIKTTEGVVPVASWQLVVLDPRGKPFRQWTGKGIPPKSVYWDGKSDTGENVESGEDYQLQLRVSDTQNHVTRKQETVTIDISVIKLAEGKYKIVVSSIQFAGYSSDVFKVQGELLTKNLFVLKRLANALGKFPGYKIRLEGYAVSEFWNDPKTAEWEQRTQLLPLSLDRAQAVRNVMVLLGIEPERFAVQGFGGDRPIVPNSDLENRWKNRRVEFYLDRT